MRRYGSHGTWGIGEREGLCIAALPDRTTRWPRTVQCKRPRGHGPDGLYCKQHAAMLAQGKVVPVGREEEEQ